MIWQFQGLAEQSPKSSMVMMMTIQMRQQLCIFSSLLLSTRIHYFSTATGISRHDLDKEKNLLLHSHFQLFPVLFVSRFHALIGTMIQLFFSYFLSLPQRKFTDFSHATFLEKCDLKGKIQPFQRLKSAFHRIQKFKINSCKGFQTFIDLAFGKNRSTKALFFCSFVSLFLRD